MKLLSGLLSEKKNAFILSYNLEFALVSFPWKTSERTVTGHNGKHL